MTRPRHYLDDTDSECERQACLAAARAWQTFKTMVCLGLFVFCVIALFTWGG